MRDCNIFKRIARSALCGVLLLPFVSVADAKEQNITEWSLGEALFGEKVDLSEVKGKVVVLEYWGVRCPPCIASLPDLAKLDKRYRDDGLLVIGAESQGHSKNQIEPIIKKAKVEYLITQGANGPVSVSGIPHIFVFDRQGNKIFDGNPADHKFEQAVKNALKEDAPREQTSDTAKPAVLFERQEWTNAKGQKMTASVLKANETTVTFVMPNGKHVDFSMQDLSDESRGKILSAIKG